MAQNLPRLPGPCAPGHDHTRYIVVGPALENCGHRHRTHEDAVGCLDRVPDGQIRGSFALGREVVSDHDAAAK